MRSRKRIAILFHANERSVDLRKYAVANLADIWRKSGLQVVMLFGTKKYVPADLAIVHVNLSVVPEDYLAFARRYPAVLNGHVRDIRKSAISQNLLLPDSLYEGPVIVKTDLNSAGMPERSLRFANRFLRRGVRSLEKRFSRDPLLSQADYIIHSHLREVSDDLWADPRFVIEKFFPEREGEDYVVHLYEFLGNHGTGYRVVSQEPIVTWRRRKSWTHEVPHPYIVALKEELRFDYGKFDYLVHDGRAALLDANKTTGQGTRSPTPEIAKALQHQAAGIHAFLEST